MLLLLPSLSFPPHSTPPLLLSYPFSHSHRIVVCHSFLIQHSRSSLNSFPSDIHTSSLLHISFCMDILEGPVLLACSALTGLYAVWQQKYQQGLGLLISLTNMVTLLFLLIKQRDGKYMYCTVTLYI
ncbi:hypothetical protein EDD21DRAFT_129122 [Dissophora ornata]|nr:hypothetical protein EDD21DRAFT_129122 [Dissophora ornata]